MERSSTLGADLARAHAEEVGSDPEHSVLNTAERPRPGGWTLRAALVRFAQPEPTRAAAVLDLVRRAEWAIAPHHKALLRHRVTDSNQAMPDVRVVGLARTLAPILDRDEAERVVADYRRHLEFDLESEELAALPTVEVLLALDDLGEVLARWAPTAPHQPPVGEVDEVCQRLHPRLEALGAGPGMGPGPATSPGSGRRPPRRGDHDQ